MVRKFIKERAITKESDDANRVIMLSASKKVEAIFVLAYQTQRSFRFPKTDLHDEQTFMVCERSS